jgi:hypothetical protein
MCVLQENVILLKKLVLEHYGYQAKTQRVICTKMLAAVRRWFQNCGNVVPARMTLVELYGTLAASSRATQPVETPCLTQSTHTNGIGGFQDGNGGPV